MQAWKECSKRLIETAELDPVYNLVAYGRDLLGFEWATRFCMAHLMFYNIGTSLTLADVDNDHFWFRVMRQYEVFKRGQERRHYRGVNGLQSIDSVRKWDPGIVFTSVVGKSLKDIRKNVTDCGYMGFGTYFILKWADLIDVVHRANLDYGALVSQPNNYLFEGSWKGLNDIWPGRPPHESLLEITDYIRQWPDPFQGYRACGLSEAETIACAYRTYYVKNTYRFGWDINNLRETLSNHPSENAKMLLEGIPEPVEGYHV